MLLRMLSRITLKIMSGKLLLQMMALKTSYMYREALDSQTSFGLSRVRDWSLETGGMRDDDIFLSADVDEIMSREAMHKLKWCETSADVLSGALWMPMGNLRKALRSHFPVLGHPHTFSIPSIYQWKSIKENKFD